MREEAEGRVVKKRKGELLKTFCERKRKGELLKTFFCERKRKGELLKTSSARGSGRASC